MKKVRLILLFIFILGLIYGVYFFFYLIVVEDYTNVKISDNLNLEVYNDYKISNIVTIDGGTIKNDRVIYTNKLGEEKIEVLYKDNKNKNKKAYINIKVVDTTKPILLGGNSYNVLIGRTKTLEHIFLSADNYTKNPKREVIGDYDMNKLGKYNVKFRVTDESGNINEKDFTLNVLSKLPIRNSTTNTRTYYDDVVKKHKNSNTKIGLDISKWQGNVDFDKLKAKNVEFIILRIGYQRGFGKEFILDEKFERNIKEANRVGIPVGLYFYSYAITKETAKEQAKWIIEKSKDYKISLPVAFDFEDWQYFSSQKLSLKDINDIAIKFMDTLEENGYKGMNYSSKRYLENIWNIDKYPVWLAHYTNKTDYSGKYAMWQMCQDGRIDGINGDVDINVMYENLINTKKL